MKGVILAGGLGTRLFPLTKITNKHLLPVFDRPMIYYPIQTLVNAGITDIMIVTGGRKSGDFLSLLGNGKEFGLKHLNYTYQEGEGGIAEALGLCEHWAAGAPLTVVLGDNLIEGNIKSAVEAFEAQGGGGKVLLKEVQHHPLTSRVMHVDFHEVRMDHKVRVSFNIHFVGTPTGVTLGGGTVDFHVRAIQVECLPGDIVESIDLDITHLDVGEHLLAGDIELDAKFRRLTADQTIRRGSMGTMGESA